MTTIRNLNAKLAIAMWDTGWLTRHYRYGSFADWNRALDGLVERGYNAIRIETFPHLVAAGPDGVVEERFYRPRGEGLEHPWRNAWGAYIEPRRGLLDFLPLCRERGVRVGLATWFPNVREDRHKLVQGVDEFVRVWDETLRFLRQHDLLDNVIYVDLLNEYPLWHGFEWLKLMLESQSAPRPGDRQGRTAAERQREVDLTCYNPRQFACYNSFAGDVLARLKEAWPGLAFFFSFTHSNSTPWDAMDLGRFDALDVHHWFVQNVEFAKSFGYFDAVHSNWRSDEGYERCQADLARVWPERKQALTHWMREKMAHVAEVGRRLGIPYGNTEGWGPIIWREHPLLEWDFLKEAGLICARLGAELGYTFNCSSNFTHPQFRGLWDDIAWHREVTGVIRS